MIRAIAVVGAHLSGMPLNGELKALGGRLLEATSTAPDYRLYALAGSNPPKPGLLRIAADKGNAIAVEVWALRAESFGRFVSAVPSPLSIGTLRLADGRTVKGFLVEADAAAGALDISQFGGWRTYLAQTGDTDLLSRVAPFFAWRALVVASPAWYNVTDAVRIALFRFIDAVLGASRFDPTRVNTYLSL